MKRLLACLLLPLLLVACSNKYESAAAKAAPAHAAAPPPEEQRFMAYEHSLEVRVASDAVASTHASILDACKALAKACTLLESRTRSGETQSAYVKMRAAPAAVKSIVAKVGSHGDVLGMHTTAEDLTVPITDGSRRLAMLKDYRAKLEALLAKSGNSPDALIKLTKELAETQHEIEASEGSQAKLRQRVDTEILSIDITAPSSRPFSRPIGAAVDEFGDNLASGIAGAITITAVVLPSALILWAVVWAVLGIRRRRKLKAG
jgi:hypothetical protein